MSSQSSQRVTGTRPDLTLAQLVAILGGGVPVVLQLLVAFAIFDPSLEQTQALNTATTWLGTMALGLFGGDAAIRIGRNYADGKTQAAAHIAAATTGPPVDAGYETIDTDVDAIDDDQLADDRTEFASPPPDAPRP